eukprot:4466125-Amphidinium_carterae.2
MPPVGTGLRPHLQPTLPTPRRSSLLPSSRRTLRPVQQSPLPGACGKSVAGCVLPPGSAPWSLCGAPFCHESEGREDGGSVSSPCRGLTSDRGCTRYRPRLVFVLRCCRSIHQVHDPGVVPREHSQQGPRLGHVPAFIHPPA